MIRVGSAAEARLRCSLVRFLFYHGSAGVGASQFRLAVLGLIVVAWGLHVALAPLVARRQVFERILAVLLVLAGLGYLVDGVGTLLNPGYGFSVSVFAFVGGGKRNRNQREE